MVFLDQFLMRNKNFTGIILVRFLDNSKCLDTFPACLYFSTCANQIQGILSFVGYQILQNQVLSKREEKWHEMGNVSPYSCLQKILL